MKTLLLSAILTILPACDQFDKVDEEPIVEPENLTALADLHRSKLAEIDDLALTGHRWVTMDCDGFIWNSRALVGGVKGIDLSAAGYPDDPGRLGRRPPNPDWCWQNGEDLGSKSTWSRDMLKSGLLVYAAATGDHDLLSRHMWWAKDHNYVTGEPLIDRVIYSPSLRTLAWRVLKATGGDTPNFKDWPQVYPKGLDGYQARLMVDGIFIEAEIDGHVQRRAVDRLKEQARRQPECPFYQYMYHRFTDGNQSEAVELLLEDGTCGYVRCNDEPGCHLAEWLFVASRILQ